MTVVCPAELRSMAFSNGRVFQHRLVMATAVGRALFADETVHHRNGDRLDNRLGNLELRIGPHGKGGDLPDTIEWALEVLRRYAPDELRSQT